MPEFVVKLLDGDKSYYLSWSTVVDAPVTSGMSLEDFRDWYGDDAELDERLARVEAKGTSANHYKSADELIAFNRAGLDETRLTKEQIIDHYCRGNPNQRGAEEPDESDDEDT